jgi:putative transposase
MPKRRIDFVRNNYYHVFNRGVDKREIFLEIGDYLRFLDSIRRVMHTGSATQKKAGPLRAQFPLGVEIIAYCLNPNHFHFVLRQNQERDLTRLLHSVCTSYTMYFNKKYKRTGRLFENVFKAIPIQSDKQLLWTVSYVNLNAELHKACARADVYPWSSFPQYLQKENQLGLKELRPNIIFKQFRNPKGYRILVETQRERLKENKRIRHLQLE